MCARTPLPITGAGHPGLDLPRLSEVQWAGDHVLPWSLDGTRLTLPMLSCDCLSPSLGCQHEQLGVQLPVPQLGPVAPSGSS